jgi:heme-degrading monooxygenase HmoA
VALGRRAADAPVEVGDTEPREALVLVEWPSREAFEGFLEDPAHADLHPLREHGTRRYLWWAYERLEDLRPLLKR